MHLKTAYHEEMTHTMLWIEYLTSNKEESKWMQ